MSTGTSTFVIRWINFLTMVLGIAVICFGVWMSTHHDQCRRTLTLPVMGLGAVILLVSLVGFLGALKNVPVLLWVYLGMLFLILVAVLVFTVVAFIITNGGSGHTVAGLRYKEYHLQDYSGWFLKQLNNSQNWIRLKSCLVKNDDCSNLSRKYKSLKEYKLAELSPIEAGCCRPPSDYYAASGWYLWVVASASPAAEAIRRPSSFCSSACAHGPSLYTGLLLTKSCGYPAKSASYYDLSYHPVSTDKDCKLYKNSRSVKCYDCDSCKAGVAEYMKTEWRIVAIFNLVLFVVLSAVYFVGCCARRNAARSHSSKVGGR